MKLRIIIIAMFLVDLALKPLQALYGWLLEARWPGFHEELDMTPQERYERKLSRYREELSEYTGYTPPEYVHPEPRSSDPCGYCDRAQPSDDPNDICQDCWEEMQARDEPTYPSPEEALELEKERMRQIYGPELPEPNEHGVTPLALFHAELYHNICHGCYLDPDYEWDDPKLYVFKSNARHVPLCAACHPDMPDPQPKQPVTIGEAFSFLIEGDK